MTRLLNLYAAKVVAAMDEAKRFTRESGLNEDHDLWHVSVNAYCNAMLATIAMEMRAMADLHREHEERAA